MKRRQMLARKFIDGVWGVELEGFDEGQAADQMADRRPESARGD